MTGIALTADAGLDVLLGKVADSLDRHSKVSRDQLRALQASAPSDVRLPFSGTSGSSGDLALVVPGPDTGYYWHVRRLIISGPAWSTTVAGTGEVYVTAVNNASYVNVRDAADLVDQASSVPNKAFYGMHEFVVRPGENVIVVIHSPTASTGYKGSLQIQQFRTLPYDGVDFTA